MSKFIAHESSDPRDETKALSATRARQLIGLPSGDSVLAARSRDSQILSLLRSSLSTGCRLKVSDFHQDGEEASIKLHEKGDKRRNIELHFAAAEAIQEYIQKAGITSGALFRPRQGSRTAVLAARVMNPVSTMYLLIQSYLERLPNSHKEIETAPGEKRKVCVYTPYSLRATAAPLLLGAGVDIRKVQELLGHRHITTTQIYDKRRRTTAESASHDMPI
jgi:site-specific recombinase XerD